MNHIWETQQVTQNQMLKPGQKNSASLWRLHFESDLCSIQQAKNLGHSRVLTQAGALGIAQGWG